MYDVEGLKTLELELELQLCGQICVGNEKINVVSAPDCHKRLSHHGRLLTSFTASLNAATSLSPVIWTKVPTNLNIKFKATY